MPRMPKDAQLDLELGMRALRLCIHDLIGAKFHRTSEITASLTPTKVLLHDGNCLRTEQVSASPLALMKEFNPKSRGNFTWLNENFNYGTC